MIQNDGNVGHGTTSLLQKLEVNGSLKFTAGARRSIKFLDPVRSLFIGANPPEPDRGPFAIHLVTDDGSGSTPRISIVGNDGNVGMGTATPNHPLEMGSAHVTAGGVWTDASSRQYKENISNLTQEEAISALEKLNPGKFNYKFEREEEYVGFIAEDVPDLVATSDRKSLSPVDIVAVLTKVVQQQQKKLRNWRRGSMPANNGIGTLTSLPQAY